MGYKGQGGLSARNFLRSQSKEGRGPRAVRAVDRREGARRDVYQFINVPSGWALRGGAGRSSRRSNLIVVIGFLGAIVVSLVSNGELPVRGAQLRRPSGLLMENWAEECVMSQATRWNAKLVGQCWYHWY